MTTVIQACNFCQEPFEADAREVRRGNAKFCSRKCTGAYKSANTVAPEPNVVCAQCQAPFYLSVSKQKLSKSGLYFCTRTHKDLAQRIGGIKAIMPPHYGIGEGLHDYRARAFAHYANECAKCSWKEYPEVLEVNHINVNRQDNSIENLEILCPTHHQVFHYLDKSGRWARQRADD